MFLFKTILSFLAKWYSKSTRISEPFSGILGPVVEESTSNVVVTVVESSALVAFFLTGLKSKLSLNSNSIFWKSVFNII